MTIDEAGPSPEQVEKWIQRVLDHSRQPRIVHRRIEDPSHPSRLVVDVVGSQVKLGEVPAGWEVQLTCQQQEGEPSQKLEVVASTPPERLIVSAWPSLRSVRLTSGTGRKEWPGSVELDLIASGEAVLESFELAIPEIVVHGGALQLNGKVQPPRVALSSASARGIGRVSGELTLSGTVQLPSGFRSSKTVLEDEMVAVQLLSDGRTGGVSSEPKPVFLGTIEGHASSAVRLRIETSVTAGSVPNGSTLELADGAQMGIAEPVESLHLRGPGVVRLVRATGIHGDEEDPPSLRLQPDDVIEGASGSVTSLFIQDAIITGASEAPLAPKKIVEAEGAELDRISVTELDGLGSLQALRSARRVVPEISTGFEELQHIAETKPPGLTAQARQVYWAQLADLVSEKKAPGAVQSSLRFVAAHSRLLAAPKQSRERAWLWLYRLVGYGERIGRPLLVHLTLAVVVFALVCFGVWGLEPAPEAHTSLGLLWDLLVLPLSFFRFAEPEVIDGGWPADALTLIVRVVGILMMFFTLAAIRRLTKAE